MTSCNHLSSARVGVDRSWPIALPVLVGPASHRLEIRQLLKNHLELGPHRHCHRLALDGQVFHVAQAVSAHHHPSPLAHVVGLAHRSILTAFGTLASAPGSVICPPVADTRRGTEQSSGCSTFS